MTDFGVSWARAFGAAALIFGALFALPHPALAVETSKYCHDGTDPTSNVDTGGFQSVDDVQLFTGSMQSASDCYGGFNPGGSTSVAETAAVNQVFGGISGTNPFVYLDRTNEAASAVGLGGIKFYVEAITFGGSGLWVVLWEDTNGSSPQNAPLMLDLAVLLVGETHSAAYLLSGLLLPFSPGATFGTFEIQLPPVSGLFGARCYDNGYDHHYRSSYDGKGNKHKSSKKDNKHYGASSKKDKHCDKPKPKLSHLLIAGRLTPSVVPEPSTTALFGVGLLGLWMVQRRRRR